MDSEGIWLLFCTSIERTINITMIMPTKKMKKKSKSRRYKDGNSFSLVPLPLPPPTSSPSADLTAKVIGDFGPWQCRISFLMALLKIPIAWYQLNIIFMAPPQQFWCVKPSFLTAFSEQEWRDICYPFIEEHPCLIYDPDYLALWPDMSKSLIPLVVCQKFVYDKSVFTRTITSDWDLVCSKHWFVHLTQCIMMWGILVGGIIFGIMADKYGRKKPLIAALVIQSVCSFIATFMPYYSWFLIAWFTLALASGGIGIISFVICMEAVSGKYRTTVPVLYQLPFGLGNAAMAGLSYWLRDWRKLEFALATLSSLFVLYWCAIPESPRWLIATGQIDEAYNILKKAAKTNGHQFKNKDVKRLLSKSGGASRQKGPTFKAFCKSKDMRLRTMLLSINWFCTGLSFYTFSQYLGSIGNNIFLAVSVSGIISTFGGIFCVVIITRVGRKTTVWVFQVMTALCFFSLLIIPKDSYSNDWPRLLCAGIGFAGMSGSIPALYLFSGELYPTIGRNAGISGVTMFARVASMMAPAVVSLDSIIVDLPLILLGIMSLCQIFLLFPLPETKGTHLPDTLEQAETFARR